MWPTISSGPVTLEIAPRLSFPRRTGPEFLVLVTRAQEGASWGQSLHMLTAQAMLNWADGRGSAPRRRFITLPWWLSFSAR